MHAMLRKQEKTNKTNALEHSIYRMNVSLVLFPEVEPAYSVECLQSGL